MVPFSTSSILTIVPRRGSQVWKLQNCFPFVSFNYLKYSNNCAKNSCTGIGIGEIFGVLFIISDNCTKNMYTEFAFHIKSNILTMIQRAFARNGFDKIPYFTIANILIKYNNLIQF